MLTGLVLAACAALLFSRNLSRSRGAVDPFGYAWALVDTGRLDEALETLDALGRRKLDGEQLLEWLNVRVVALGMAGRCDEALEIAEGLETLDEGDGNMRLVVVGNRAIALLHADRFAEAEPLLDETEQLADGLRSAGNGFSADVNLAETWWWRGEIARRRGDSARRRECLTRAASFGAVRWAERARRALAGSDDGAAP